MRSLIQIFICCLRDFPVLNGGLRYGEEKRVTNAHSPVHRLLKADIKKPSEPTQMAVYATTKNFDNFKVATCSLTP